MDFIKQYVKYNDFFRKKLLTHIQFCKEHPDSYSSFLNQLEDPSIDLEGTIYKLLADESEIINLSSGSYELLPVGLINKNVPSYFVDDLPDDNKHGVQRNTLNQMLFKEPNYDIFYYSNDTSNTIDENSLKPSIDSSSFKKIRESYIDYYRESLGEVWSEKDFYEMLKSLKYLAVKYAKDTKTGELIAIEFFGAQLRNAAGGLALTNAELYVMSEFRGMGIAKKLVGVTFSKAKMDGIENFDSITYRTPTMNALKFWESIGAQASGLYHIEGNIPEMMEKINNITRNI